MAGQAITERSGLALGRAIRAGELSSREVVEAHIELLQRVEPDLGGIAVDRYDAARAEADAADERVAAAADGDELPPLLGVPCTIKESIWLEGMPNTVGGGGAQGPRVRRVGLHHHAGCWAWARSRWG